MRACAQLAVTRSTRGRCPMRISRLHSEPPLVLRPINRAGHEPLHRWNLKSTSPARVALVAGAAGPLGGDELHLDVEVAAGAALVLRSIAATLLLPGPHRRRSTTRITIRVAADATFVWLPQPTIAARGCDHQAVTRISLEPGARLLLREELMLGRHGEQPGSVHQRLRICMGDRPLHDQELRIGPEAAGWDGPAVLGGRRAVGSLLIVDPDWAAPDQTGPDAFRPAVITDTVDTDAGVVRAARFPLDGPAMLVTAVAPDALALRRRLNAGLAALEQPTPAPTVPLP
jgi:urease accessory protein